MHPFANAPRLSNRGAPPQATPGRHFINSLIERRFAVRPLPSTGNVKRENSDSFDSRNRTWVLRRWRRFGRRRQFGRWWFHPAPCPHADLYPCKLCHSGGRGLAVHLPDPDDLRRRCGCANLSRVCCERIGIRYRRCPTDKWRHYFGDFPNAAFHAWRHNSKHCRFPDLRDERLQHRDCQFGKIVQRASRREAG